jgi:hypothetical protein
MTQDPFSRVASWITSATPAEAADRSLETSAGADDPVIPLIAEVARLDALWIAAQTCGDEIFDALPEDIRKGRVKVSFSGELAGLLANHNGFTNEADLHRWVRVHRDLATVFVRVSIKMGRLSDDKELAAAEAEFDQEIGLEQALAQLRAGLTEIKAIREAAGCEAHYREAEDLGRRGREGRDRIRNTKPVTLAGAIAMLELGHECGYCDERLTNAVIAGLRDMQQASDDGLLAARAEEQEAEPEVIGFGEPEAPR